MDFFDRHKALIITSLLFSVIILALYTFNLSNNNQKTRELLVDLENFRAEPPEEKEEDQLVKAEAPQLQGLTILGKIDTNKHLR